MDIVYEGKVLTGRQRVMQRHREVEVMELISRAEERRGLPERERYADMEDYDPVLRWHCRM
jgi:hypothetical protein